MILSRLHDTLDIRKILREACKLKNVPKSGQSPKQGEGVTNVNFLIRGGEAIFSFFPKFKKSKLSGGGESRKLWTFSTFCDIF